MTSKGNYEWVNRVIYHENKFRYESISERIIDLSSQFSNNLFSFIY